MGINTNKMEKLIMHTQSGYEYWILNPEKREMKTKEKLKIDLKKYRYSCPDGCCYNYGTIVKVNGDEMPYHDQDVETILRQVLEHLGYEVGIE